LKHWNKSILGPRKQRRVRQLKTFWTMIGRSGPTLLTRPARLREACAIAASRLFDEAYYCRRYPDVAASRLTPLAHFVLKGAFEGRNPHTFFDCSYYLNLYPDVARSHANPLVHFAHQGWREGRRPSPAFDTAYYLSQYADVRLLDENPLVHYLEHGWL